MTRVDFYLLPDVDVDAKLRFACRLAYRANSRGQQVHVRTASPTLSSALDDLMWSYPEDHFLPHAIATHADAAQSPIRIGHEEPPPDADEVLINLADDVPGFFGRYERVAEVVVQPEKELGRARYRHYRDRGYPLFHHDLDDWEAR